jgi:CRISPR/Cas system-associated endonuclease Cas1
LQNKEKAKYKNTMTLAKYFEVKTNIQSNKFVEDSLEAMWKRYNLNDEFFKIGIDKLIEKIDKLNTYDDLMRFLAGIYRNDSERAINFKKMN